MTTKYGVYAGTVVSNADPTKKQKVRLHVPQALGTATSGWAAPLTPVTAPPAVGTLVWVLFQAGDTRYPVYSAIKGSTPTGGGSATRLVDLADVSAPSPTNGQVLHYVSARADWEPYSPPSPNVAGGYAALDSNAKVASAQLPDLSGTYQAISTKNLANGYAGLDGNAKVSASQVPDLSGTYQVLSTKNAANGYAGLDANAKVSTSQIPDLSATYIAVGQKGAANGVATLDANGKLVQGVGPNPWNWTITNGTTDGFTINGTSGTTKQIFTIKDYQGSPIFSVGHVGGAAVYGDHFKVFNGGDIINPTTDIDPAGKIIVTGTGQLVLGGQTLTASDITKLHGLVGANPWTFAMSATNADGLIVKSVAGSLNSMINIQDGGGNTMFNVSPLGGTGVFNSQLRVFDSFSNVTVTLDPSGTLKLGATTLNESDIQTVHNVSTTYVPNSAKGAASGVATLDANSHLAQMPALPSLGVYRNGGLALTAGTAVALGWDNEHYQDNVAANAMHSTTTNNTRLIAPVAGKYLISVTAHVASNASAPVLTLSLRLNGATTDLKKATTPGVASQINSVHISIVYKLAAGDYVEAYLLSTLAQNLTAGSATTFGSMTYLSA